MLDIDTHEAGGAALLLGFLVVLVTLYREPASGVAAATASPGAVLYCIVLPAAGLLAGAYVSLGGPYSGVPLFLLGSYLGLFGLGLLLSGLATVALVASAWWLAAVLRLGSVGNALD
jgi:hypothetical protein